MTEKKWPAWVRKIPGLVNRLDHEVDTLRKWKRGGYGSLEKDGAINRRLDRIQATIDQLIKDLAALHQLAAPSLVGHWTDPELREWEEELLRNARARGKENAARIGMDAESLNWALLGFLHKVAQMRIAHPPPSRGRKHSDGPDGSLYIPASVAMILQDHLAQLGIRGKDASAVIDLVFHRAGVRCPSKQTISRFKRKICR